MDVRTVGTITGKIGVGTPGAILAGVFLKTLEFL